MVLVADKNVQSWSDAVIAVPDVVPALSLMYILGAKLLPIVAVFIQQPTISCLPW